MWLILSLLSVLAYYFNPFIGMIIVLVIILKKLLINNKNFLDNLIICIIFTIPLSYVNIIDGTGSTQFNWFIILNIIFIIYCLVVMLKGNTQINILLLSTILFFSTTLLVRNLLVEHPYDALISVLRILIMIITPFLFYTVLNSKKIVLKLSPNEVFKVYSDVAVAYSICLIIQYALYNYLNIEVGVITFNNNRIIYDGLFTGFSIVSAYLSSGGIILFIKLLNKFSFLNLFLLGIIFIGIFINSSRTGFISFLITVALIVILNILSGKIKTRFILITPLLILISFIGINWINNSRKQIEGIFYDNGRFEAWISAISVFKRNPIFGSGFDFESLGIRMFAHNFLLEFLMQTGIIIFAVFIILIGSFLIYGRNNIYIYIVINILISNLFITEIYGHNYFLVTLLLILYTNQQLSKKNRSCN